MVQDLLDAARLRDAACYQGTAGARSLKTDFWRSVEETSNGPALFLTHWVSSSGPRMAGADHSEVAFSFRSAFVLGARMI
jgi:hypothetical protein